ncbi:hypothetical protein CU040_1980 [Enterococcus faecium]|nr:hypothetical protein [Enterococcus faecium]MBK4809535.1 hypothetical protein [Enterococcus faecium]MBK4843404.1 hypothetical protein [Enterococcus faecium]
MSFRKFPIIFVILLENETRARPKIFMKKLKSKKIALSITRIIPVYKNILALSLLISVIFLPPITFR